MDYALLIVILLQYEIDNNFMLPTIKVLFYTVLIQLQYINSR